MKTRQHACVLTSALLSFACVGGEFAETDGETTAHTDSELTSAARGLTNVQALEANSSAGVLADNQLLDQLENPLLIDPGLLRPHFFKTVFTLAAPTGLTRTLSSAECAAHIPVIFADAFCQASIANGDVMLLWNWDASTCKMAPCSSDIDGYRIWLSDFKKPTKPLDTQIARFTGRGVPQTALGSRTCYVVTAYKGENESPPSEPFCFDNLGPLSKTLSVAPTQLATFVRSDNRNWSPPGGTGTGPAPVLDKLAIGFDGDSGFTVIDEPPFFDTYWYWYAWRSGVKFNLGNATFKNVERATLKIDDIHAQGDCSKHGLKSAEDFTVNVAAADESWGPGLQSLGTNPAPVEGAFAAAFTLRQFHERGDLAELDVTNVVREWALKPATNRGFLLRGPVEQSTESSKCVLIASGFSLDIVFQEPSFRRTPFGLIPKDLPF